MDRLSPAARRRVYRVVCYLAYADDELGLAERDLLDGLREKLELDPADADALEAEGQAGESILLDAESEEGILAVKALTEVMVADGVLHPAEALRLKRIAARVGVSEEKLAKLLKASLLRAARRSAQRDERGSAS